METWKWNKRNPIFTLESDVSELYNYIFAPEVWINVEIILRSACIFFYATQSNSRVLGR